MPDWPTIQAVAASVNCKIIIRLPLPARDSGFAYYFQLRNTLKTPIQYTQIIETTNSEPATFHRFFASDKHPSGYGSSRLYNSVLHRHWGFFQPKPNGQWYEYLTINKTHWAFNSIWAAPNPGQFSKEALSKDPQAIWGSQIPIPPTANHHITGTTRGRNPQTETNGTELNIGEDPDFEEDDIFDYSVDPVVANNLRTHVIANTATRTVISETIISETINSIFGSSSSSTQSSTGPSKNQEPHTEKLIDISLGSSDSSSIPPGQKEPANINSPIRPESDEWLQPPINGTPPKTTPIGRPKTLGLLIFKSPTAAHTTSTPMDRAQQLESRLKSAGYKENGSQYPIITEKNQPIQGINPQTLSDERVRELGIIDAQLSNLEYAIVRNHNKQSDGRPPINMIGTKVQSPSPDLVFSEDLLKDINTVALKAMTQMSNMLIAAQLKAMATLDARKNELLSDWTPTDEEMAAAERIEASRTHKETTYNSKPIPGGRTTFRIDKQESGLSLMPSLEPNSTSGFRTPGQKNIPPRPRYRYQSPPPRDPDTYMGVRPKTTYRGEPNLRYRNEERYEDKEQPRFDRQRNTRYFQQ
jgi:hypothetical protein